MAQNYENQCSEEYESKIRGQLQMYWKKQVGKTNN